MNAITLLADPIKELKNPHKIENVNLEQRIKLAENKISTKILT